MNPERWKTFLSVVRLVMKPQGMKAVAAALGKSDTLLRHETDPNAPHKLGVRDLDRIMDITGDDRPLHHWANARGWALVRLPERGLGVEAPLRAMNHVSADVGKSVGVLLEATDPASDGGAKITPAEFAAFRAENQRTITDIMESQAAAEKMVDWSLDRRRAVRA